MLAANAFLKINARKVRNALAANNPVVPDPATLLPDAGLPTSSPGRACPAARATSASPRAPARTLPRAYLSSSSSPEKVAEIGCHHAPRIISRKTPQNPRNITFYALKQPRAHRKQTTRHTRASLRWWTESRCDSLCLRSRHFVAWLRRGPAHDAIANASLN